MKNRKEEIKKKGFKMQLAREIKPDVDALVEHNFGKMKVGISELQDAVINLGEYKRVDSRLSDKLAILRAIKNNDISFMKEASDFFYRTSGIYNRLCRYMAYLYRYDWFVTPYVNEKYQENNKVDDKVLENFYKVLLYLDNFGAKNVFGEIALTVLRNGCYYGYIIETSTKVVIQELPSEYCRSRFMTNGHPAVEFNMSFFDKQFKDPAYRMKVLKMFPKEFSQGYLKYKKKKLPPTFVGDSEGWYLLDPNYAIKFNLNGEDFPAFISVIPAIIDLDAAKELDKKKMAQQLLKIIIQKMPIDKNGDLVFDVDEAQELHNNAVRMLAKAIGIDVLTTFADVDVADLSDRSNTTTVDELQKVERTVYNEAGVSQKQFNTDGNVALEKSILNDEAAMYNLITQFESFLNTLLEKFNNQSKKFYYRVQILPTTIYNYKELAKLYKEQTQLGYSKMLPQIALGQSQSSILATAYFENELLDLPHVFIPPLMSSTMNAEALDATGSRRLNSNSDNTGGRPEKENDQKSEKTIQNLESQS